MRMRVWRITAVSAAFVVTGGPAAFAQDATGDPLVASGEPPVVATAEPVVETGTVDGATVAVGLPPVPPPAVDVGTPPVPPASAAEQVGRPPLPNLPDTGDADAAEVAASIAGTVAAIAGDAWQD
jgi:hypothetical protein